MAMIYFMRTPPDVLYPAQLCKARASGGIWLFCG
jgi:hypothetical protein